MPVSDIRDVRFHAYSVGDFRASACTNMTDEAAVVQMNLEHPDAAGPWRVSDQSFGAGTLADGTKVDHVPNGTPCPDGTAGCRHVLFARGDERLRGDATPQ